ncbi:MAG: OB-fold domain-containing protein [Proteobacteria bacterium]|nr:OB-fold domain-containing protein [Pseudomonadota bacterium]
MANSKPVMSMYDAPMWESIGRHRLELQTCSRCARFRYPPAPICANCLSLDYRWHPIAGRGTILSWVIFHRQYFDDHVPPYNVVAVQIEEGPIILSNLVGPVPEGSWIGAEVEFCYGEHAGRMQHQVRLREHSSIAAESA